MDGRKYDWPRATITGAELRALVPGLNPEFAITLEAETQHGLDRVIKPEDVIELVDTPSFYTAPPATFGRNPLPAHQHA